jgi:chemotaxis protein MotA
MAEPVMTSPPETLGPEPVLRVEQPRQEFDAATFFGLVGAIALITVAVMMGQSKANFFDLAAVMIVVFGTAAVTSISYTSDELNMAWAAIKASVIRSIRNPTAMARQLLDLSTIAKRKGILAVSQNDAELNKDPDLKQAMILVADGFVPHDIEKFLSQEIDTLHEKNRKAASVLRRGAEIAPGMGLIGTLVGLVQMLAQLDNPSAIGPAMAIALLTTFYGAIMGTIILAPLAAKIERNATDEALIRTLIMAGASSIARQENPRRLEITLNSILPPSQRVSYF